MLCHEVEPFTANLYIAHKLICIRECEESKFNNNLSILLLLFLPLNLPTLSSELFVERYEDNL